MQEVSLKTMLDKIKEAWKGLFLLNCLPWVSLFDVLGIGSNQLIVLLSLPTTVVTCLIFTIPVVIYQIWYEYKLYRKYK